VTFIVMVALLALVNGTGCDGSSEPGPIASAPVASATEGVTVTPVATVTSVVTSAAPSRTPAVADPDEPLGFPLDETLRTDEVVGETGQRGFAVALGPSVREVSADRHSGADPEVANANGWNCRVHQEYEGAPAVDWYVQPGAPVYATMDGEATLFANTIVNAFDYYGVDREPYIGNPDRDRAPVSPFPGPGGGMGVYVAVVSKTHRAAYGHFALDATIANVPEGAFRGRFSRSFDYAAEFSAPRRFDVADQVAVWQVKRGDVIGYTGDAGYSEAPHLHYAITRRNDGTALCPTSETGFADGGWLFR
jgi:hypothetical protein